MQKTNSGNPFLANRWQFTDQCLSWQDAIKLACQPLISNHAITNNYVNAIINTVEQSGPYFILSEGFAMPHARPEDGVQSSETQFSLLKCAKPVIFPNQQTVTLFIVLAASNNEQHINAITYLINWLEDKQRLTKLLKANSIMQLISIL